ncbi:hypothetical protein M9Y10_011324 [Tritrichomonas musculus]|uniref:UBR-type domain-containing protein n=1 Tax=Tritrichomonas musculus TaxID=1915356 RepID=A0ABR2GK00_9EUKA
MFRIDPITPFSFDGNKMIQVNQANSEDEILNAILSLSTFDISKIPSDFNEIISNNWCSLASKAINAFSTTCPTMSCKSLIAFIYLGRVAAILESKKLKSQKQSCSPISAVTGRGYMYSSNIQQSLTLEYFQIPDVSNEIRLVNYLFNLFNMKHFDFYDVIIWSIQLTIINENLYSAIPNFNEIEKMPNAISFTDLRLIVPKNPLSFAIIKFLYNKIFKVHVNFPFNLKNNNLDFTFDSKIPEHLCWSNSFPCEIDVALYLFSNSFPDLTFLSLAKDIEKIPIGIFTLIALNFECNLSEIAQKDVDEVMDIIKSVNLPYQSILLLLLYSTTNDLFQKSLSNLINNPSLSTDWKNATMLLSNSKNCAVDRYIFKASNGNIKAAKKLCYFPECYEKIKENQNFPLNYVKLYFEDNIHQNLEIKPESTIENSILLYKLSQNNLLISNDCYLPLIKQCHSVFVKNVQNAFSPPNSDWIMSGCSNFSGSFFIPKYPSEFIFDPKGNEAFISFLNAFYSSKCLKDQKLPEISEVTDFFTSSITSLQFINTFPKYSPKEIQKSKIFHIDSAFKLDKGKFIEKVCNIAIRSNSNFSTIVEVLTNHDAFDVFQEIISKDLSLLQYFAVNSHQCNCKFISQYLSSNDIQQKSPNELLLIMQQILTIDDTFTDSMVYKVLASISEANPELALNLLHSLPLKKTFAETVLSSIKNIPSPIPTQYLLFIKETANMLEKVQCQSSFTPMKALKNDWKEDNETQDGESKMKKKTKKTIWDYPDDIGECTQILTGHNYQNQPWFYCYTCGLIDKTGCCLPCALRCHKHHDIVYSKNSSFFCDCYEKIEICKFLQDKFAPHLDPDSTENKDQKEDQKGSLKKKVLKREYVIAPKNGRQAFIQHLNGSSHMIIVNSGNDQESYYAPDAEPIQDSDTTTNNNSGLYSYLRARQQQRQQLQQTKQINTSSIPQQPLTSSSFRQHLQDQMILQQQQLHEASNSRPNGPNTLFTFGTVNGGNGPINDSMSMNNTPIQSFGYNSSSGLDSAMIDNGSGSALPQMINVHPEEDYEYDNYNENDMDEINEIILPDDIESLTEEEIRAIFGDDINPRNMTLLQRALHNRLMQRRNNSSLGSSRPSSDHTNTSTTSTYRPNYSTYSTSFKSSTSSGNDSTNTNNNPYSFSYSNSSFKSTSPPFLRSNIRTIFFREQPNLSLSNNPSFGFRNPHQQQITTFTFNKQTGSSNTSNSPASTGFSTTTSSSTGFGLKSSTGFASKPSTSTSTGFTAKKTTFGGFGSNSAATTTGFGSNAPSTSSKLSSNAPPASTGFSTGSTYIGFGSKTTTSNATKATRTGFATGTASFNTTSSAFNSNPFSANSATTSAAPAAPPAPSASTTGTTTSGSTPRSGIGFIWGRSRNQDGPNSSGNLNQSGSNSSFRSTSDNSNNNSTTGPAKTTTTTTTAGFGPSSTSFGTGFVSSFGTGIRYGTSTFGNASASSESGQRPINNNNNGPGFNTRPSTAFGSRPSQSTINNTSYGARPETSPSQKSPFSMTSLGPRSDNRSSPNMPSSIYGATLSTKNNVQSNSKQIKAKQDPINVLTAIMIISKLLNVKVIPPAPIKNQLTIVDDIKDIKLQSVLNCEPNQFAHFENTGFRCIESTSSFITLGGSVSLPQINICAAIGSNYNKLIVCEGSNAKIFDPENNQMLSSTELRINPLRISVSQIDGTTFALASSTEVYVYSLNELNGTIELNHKIELMLEELGRSLFVVSVDWVPHEPLHLAITCTNFVKIYDIPTDCISPIVCFNTKDRITSAFMTVYDDEPYVFVSTNSGRIYYDKCNNESYDGPAMLIKILPINLSSYSNSKLTSISYSEESDLLFISALGAPLVITHLTQIMDQIKDNKGKQKIQQKPNHFGGSSSTNSSISIQSCSIKISGHHENLILVGSYPDIPSIFIMRNRINGDVVILEFTDKGVSSFTVVSPSSPIQTSGPSISIPGIVITNGEVCAVASDGYLYKLVSGKHQSSSVMRLVPPPIPSESSKSGKMKKAKKKQSTGLILGEQDNDQTRSSATPSQSLSTAVTPTTSTTLPLSNSISDHNRSSQVVNLTETNSTINDLSNLTNSGFSIDLSDNSLPIPSFETNDSLILSNFEDLNVSDTDDEEPEEEMNDSNDDDGNDIYVDDDDLEEEEDNDHYHHRYRIPSSEFFLPPHHRVNDISEAHISTNGARKARSQRLLKIKYGEIDGFSFDVPATFWVESRIETALITISDQYGSDVSNLLMHRSKCFHDRTTTLTITLNDSKNVIVGFKLCFDFEKRSIRTRPESVKIFNRRYVSTQSYPRDFCLPLKKSEVGINKKYKIDLISRSMDLDIDGVDVFVVDASTLEIQDNKDWINDASFITDFVDVPEIKCENDVDFIIKSMSAANFLPLKSSVLLSNKKEIDNQSEKENFNDIILKEDEEVKKLFVWMYTNSKISMACRRILIKVLRNDAKRFENLCTDAIIEICENENEGSEKCIKKLMWRDYAFLPQQHKKRIGDLIWKFYDSECGALGLSAAFLFEK